VGWAVPAWAHHAVLLDVGVDGVTSAMLLGVGTGQGGGSWWSGAFRHTLAGGAAAAWWEVAAAL